MKIIIQFKVLIYFVLLSLQHHRYPDFQASLIIQPSSIHFSYSL
ncbi:Uncharacterized protein APZ42_008645 [Daphnia magna]|uniref:Uncharacterized protein n=1 Tax=Daphnia magna TaxID=35525 RepID=A0A164EI93_9CRUS|nr:Uncharacterized protein APZ42_008645 [Daphnia magna]